VLVTKNGSAYLWYFDAVEAMVADAIERIGSTLQAELDEN
jgi:hypothetical protein